MVEFDFRHTIYKGDNDKKMRGISIYSWFGFNIPMGERFKLMKRVGFDSTFIWWGDEYVGIDGPKEKHPDMARRNGLLIENVHLPFSNANELWTDSLESEDIIKGYACSIEECADYNIPTAVLHLTSGNNPPSPSVKGLDRIKKLVELAGKKAVNIALENLRKPEYLEFIFSNIQSDRLGFCYDSGHENCYTKGTDFLSIYGSRLMALHLHDNDGTDDQHLIPGEGNVDWYALMKKLNGTRYSGAIALEVTNEFSQCSENKKPEMFLKRAFEAAKRLCE